jgi:hypothetical protein
MSAMPAGYVVLRADVHQVNFMLAGGPLTVTGEATPLSAALADVIAERTRQVTVEGWDAAHDDAHSNGCLARAAGCYALEGGRSILSAFPKSTEAGNLVPRAWPFDAEWWKPGTDQRRTLVKAGALILAELERMDRKAQVPAKAPTEDPPRPDATALRCTAAPAGWSCSREAGHTGPCAATEDGLANRPAAPAPLEVDGRVILRPIERSIWRDQRDAYLAEFLSGWRGMSRETRTGVMTLAAEFADDCIRQERARELAP